MFRELKWSESLRTHESSVVNEFHKAKSYGEQRQLAEKLSFERDRNQSPAILQNLYVGEKVHKTYQQLLEEYQEKMEKLRSKYGATDVSIANLSPFTLNAFQDDDEEENGAVSLNSLFNSAGYKYSKRLTNSYDKAKLRRLRTVPTKAYINHHLWSARAINIEEQLRQLSIPNDICVDKLLFTYDRIQTGLAYGFVDTFWPTHGENSVKRDCIGRLSIYTETMLKFNPSLAKVSISKCL
ncbi:hypothetical protein EON65_04385 [archaeon]|nr:MAG: hypothetical protein EON65_04385 [archaeon]